MQQRIWALGAAAVLSANLCWAQRILYDSTRDAQAQTTVSAAKSVTSASLFETQLRNLDQVARQQLETVLKWQEVQMRASLNRFATWGDITGVLNRVDVELKPFLDDRESEAALAATRDAEIKLRSEELRKQIAAIQAAAKKRSSAADEIFAHLGKADELVEFSAGIPGTNNPASVTALNEVVATLEQISKLYSSVQGILAAKAAVSVPVSSLRPNPLETELQLLEVEEKHWKALGLIRARQTLEVGEIKLLLDLTRVFAGRYPASESIEDTFNRFRMAPDRAQLQMAIYTVHRAAAVAAQQATCASLADLRKTIELRRYSIEQSSVNAGVYEQTARAAADRLAIYWKAGIRPKDLAELMLHLSTAVSLPIIAAQ
jgi:hypothetical protein